MSESAPRIKEAIEILARRDFERTLSGPLRKTWEEFCEWKDGEYADALRDQTVEGLTLVLPLLCGGLEEELKQVRKERDEAKEAVRRQVAGREAEASKREQEVTQGERDLDAERARQQHRADTLTQQLNQVREAIHEVVEGDGTGNRYWLNEELSAGQIAGKLTAILDSSSSVSGDGGSSGVTEQAIYDAAVAFTETLNPHLSGEAKGDEISALCETGMPEALEAARNSGDVEERGEEGVLALVQARVNELRRDALSSGDTRAICVINRVQEALDTAPQPNPEPHLSGDGERLEELAKTFEEWGAENAEQSVEEGDVPDERYKAFQLAADQARLLASRLSSEEGRCTCHLLKHPHHPVHCAQVIEANRAGRKEAEAARSSEGSSGVEEGQHFELIRGVHGEHLLPKGMYRVPENGTILTPVTQPDPQPDQCGGSGEGS